jgi:NADPH2:quinone reductase
MILGTAGFTAGLALKRLLQNGQTPSIGPLLVTGASGGVGQFAIELFTRSGFEVWALTGKTHLHDRLKELGAKRVLSFDDVPLSSKPLDRGLLGGIVDNLGGAFLAGILPQVRLWGNIACVGLASGHELNTTVLPFILRGVSLIGVSSNNTPRPLREKIWQSLSGDLKPKNLEKYVSQVVGLEDVLATASDMLARKTHGRVLVDLNTRS